MTSFEKIRGKNTYLYAATTLNLSRSSEIRRRKNYANHVVQDLRCRRINLKRSFARTERSDESAFLWFESGWAPELNIASASPPCSGGLTKVATLVHPQRKSGCERRQHQNLMVPLFRAATTPSRQDNKIWIQRLTFDWMTVPPSQIGASQQI